MTELSATVFRALLSLVTGGVAAVWLVHDLVLITRLRGADRRDPRIADRRFGYVIGIVIGVIGIVGTLRFNGVF
ncbi:MAG: hypothetical protein E6J90_05380 [Deltaproteobacteria bacterium]|nr:MAG: hypothetical protein E6J90_05380 [Deltaproteobacteria bacterium]